MKKYRLKQWYPSLDEKWDTTHRYEYQSSTGYMCNKAIQHCVIIYKKELHPDFWELIEEKEPLFITDDGVEVFNEETTVYCITRGHNKHEENYRSMRKIESYLKTFFHESNADEYAWKNKRVFSYEDMMKAKHSILITNEDIEKSAKERIEE